MELLTLISSFLGNCIHKTMLKQSFGEKIIYTFNILTVFE